MRNMVLLGLLNSLIRKQRECKIWPCQPAALRFPICKAQVICLHGADLSIKLREQNHSLESPQKWHCLCPWLESGGAHPMSGVFARQQNRSQYTPVLFSSYIFLLRRHALGKKIGEMLAALPYTLTKDSGCLLFLFQDNYRIISLLDTSPVAALLLCELSYSYINLSTSQGSQLK